MVIEYLEKTRQQFIEESICLVENKTNLQNNLKENIKLIQLLEESNDPNYAAFTPRKINSNNAQKIEELKINQETINQELERLDVKISEINFKIDEIDRVINFAKKNQFSYTLSNQEENLKFKLGILEARENEKQRIARELHDSTVQNLTALIHKTELCMKLQDIDPIRCKLELSSLNKNLKYTINDMRNMIYDLRPMSFDDIGLDITIQNYLDKLRKQSTIQFIYNVSGNKRKINDVIELSILRIIQEASMNSLKYSNASKVTISLKYDMNNIHLSITDDGIGFDKKILENVSHENNSKFGISMMKERVYLLSGNFDLITNNGEGCCINIDIPINMEEIND